MVTGEITWSPEHERLLGLSPGTFDGRYETFVACMHPDDREGLNQAVAHALQHRVPYHHEYRVVWADGSTHWIEGRGDTFYNEGGQPVQMIGTIMAIEERKQAEAELRDRECLLSTLAEALPVVIFRFDQNQHCVYINNYWTVLTGRTIESVMGFGWVETLHPQDRDRLTNEWLEWSQNAQQRGLYQNEGRLIHVSGKDVWYYIQALPEVNTQGETVGFIGVMTNITDRKQVEASLQQSEARLRLAQAELALQESEERLRLALDLTYIGFWDMQLSDRSIIWNDNHSTLLGLPPETCEPSYELWRNHVHPDDLGWVEPLFLASIEQHTDYAAEYRVIHSDGSVHWLMGRGRALYGDDGQPLRSIGVLLDVTDRKQAEQTLALQAVIARNMAEGICLVKADNATIVYANPKFEQMFGYDTGELNNQPVAILHYPNGSVTAEDVYQSIRSSVLQNREFTYEVHNIKKDGTSFWCSTTCSVFQHPEYGDVLVVVQQDITERRKLDQMKQDFISIVSHELRTPLTSIRGALGLIAGGIYDKKPEKMKEMIAIAARQSDRLVRLVNDILNLRRLESGQSKFKFQQNSAADLIQQSVDVMHSQAEQSQITLDIMPTTAEVWADADAIVQTLTNLLSNAIKFSPPNSTITITATPHLTTSPSPHTSTCFSVQDRGRGIPSDQLESIFGQFQQVDASDSREKGGTGLGLAICRTIVKQHGGQIWVESTLEQGSTFYFTLPSAQPSSDNSWE